MVKKKAFSFSNEADNSDSVESLDGNVYYNTTLDEAVLHYYDYIFSKKVST